MLKTLGKTTWDKIKVGEVFAFDGCWEIYTKDSESYVRLITDDWREFDFVFFPYDLRPRRYVEYGLYKLPLSTQRLWRQDT